MINIRTTEEKLKNLGYKVLLVPENYSDRVYCGVQETQTKGYIYYVTIPLGLSQEAAETYLIDNLIKRIREREAKKDEPRST